MPSPRSAIQRLLIPLLLAASCHAAGAPMTPDTSPVAVTSGTTATGTAATSAAATNATATPSAADIARALAVVKADPKLGGTHSERVLHWKDSGAKKETKVPLDSPFWDGVASMFSTLGYATRMLVWGAVIIAVALLVILVLRLLRTQRADAARQQVQWPSFVGGLDIRAESLPADIGAAARALWDGGQHRAALALLYRGMLARLVQVFAVPIRSSSTETECLQLARPRINAQASEYAARLVSAWQNAVYGGTDPSTVHVHELCQQFAASLAPRPHAPAVAPAPESQP